MSNISAILPKNSHASHTRATPIDAKPQAFTRKPSDIASVAGKDQALSPEAALVREVDRLFPNVGTYAFTYDGKTCRIQRQANTHNLAIEGPADRLVMIRNGVILDEHVLQGDLQAFLGAARGAQPV